VARRQAWTAVERLTAAGTTVVLTTHYLEEAQPAGRPRTGPVLAGHVRYQLLLLLRSPRALWAGVLLPVMLLVLTNLQQHQVAAASMAGAAGLGAPVPLGAAAAPGTPPSQALTARWTRAPAPPHRSRTAAAGGDW
jgi:hypothetical protein